MVNPEWRDIFWEGDIFVLAARSLDHCPLVVSYGEKRVADGGSDEIEASWLVNDACYNVVKDAWEVGEFEGDQLYIFQSKLEQRKCHLIK